MHGMHHVSLWVPRVVLLLPLLLCGSLGWAAEVSGLPAIVFVSREFNGAPNPNARPSAVELARAGKLLVREPDGRLRTLVDAAAPGAPSSTPVDVADPDVFYDATRIVFSGYSTAEYAWRIFEVRADGTDLRKLTSSNRQIDLARYGAASSQFERYDDLDPCYLPDGRVCFVSTRSPGTAPDGRLQTTNLYVMSPDGSDLHRITSERFAADTPTVEPSTGRIVYSRWWRTAQLQADPSGQPPEPIPPGSPGYGDIVVNPSEIVLRGIQESDFPGVNSWFLAGINPDGTDLAMFAGFRLDRAATQAYRPSFLSSGEAIALFIPKTPFLGYPRGNGLRRFAKGPGAPVFLGGPENFGGRGTEPPRPIDTFYASAAALADGRLLVTAAPAAAPAPDYGVYVQENSDSAPLLIYNSTSAAELDAVPLTPRSLPPVVVDRNQTRMIEEAPRSVEEAFAQGGSFTFKVENIFFNAPVDVPMPNAPPVGKKLAIEFYMGPQRTSTTASDPPILIRRLDIPLDGKVATDLPAGVPLFEVLRRSDNTIPLGRDGQIFHVGGFNFGRAGETNRCVGCHSGHSQLALPEDTSWTNVAPSAIVSASSFRSANRDPAVASRSSPFAPVNIVDRRTDRRDSEWAAEDEPTATVKLRWGATIRARELKVYGPALGGGQPGTRDEVIHGLSLATFLEGLEVQSLTVKKDVLPGGTSIALDSGLEFDTLVISVSSRDVTGLYEGRKGAALAEVEVIAQVTGEPKNSFIRGDADCNGQLQLTDSIRILGQLFLGGRGICCMAAADANDDTNVNISDAIFLLNFLFLGGSPMPPPFPSCEPAPTSGLTCDGSVCG